MNRMYDGVHVHIQYHRSTMYDGVHVYIQYHSDEYCDSSSYDDIGWSD